MSSEDYYCPLCGNKPFGSFVPCRILEQQICDECDSTIRQFFLLDSSTHPEPPSVIQNLSNYSGLPLRDCNEMWHKERVVSLLLDMRDLINYYDESGDIWESRALKALLCQAGKVNEAGSFLRDQLLR
ncbi:hypothetical protein [Citrifermentans bremense]|uniref:hypothetical protein n=1 Tax=Citrifermentans bremense TaxID=60035 RepID=UPI0012EB949C|nr:hypothetical protein [Citrifermentans bremense]